MRKLTIEKKIKVIEMAINMGRNVHRDDSLFMCNLIKQSAIDLKILTFEHYSFVNSMYELAFLEKNFSELCLISNKYIQFQIAYQYFDESGFCFDGRPWFDGHLHKNLKINILCELLELYKKQKDER